MRAQDRLDNIVKYKSRIEEYTEKRNEQILAAYEEGISVATLANAIKFSRRGIYHILSKQGIAFSVKP